MKKVKQYKNSPDSVSRIKYGTGFNGMVDVINIDCHVVHLTQTPCNDISFPHIFPENLTNLCIFTMLIENYFHL